MTMPHDQDRRHRHPGSADVPRPVETDLFGSRLAGESSWRRRVPLGALVAALALCHLAGAGATTTAARLQDLAGSSPATGDARVLAQGVADVPAADLAWRVVLRSAPTPAGASPVEGDLGFVVPTDGALLIEDATGERLRLAAGEAALSRAGAEQIRAALGPNAVAYYAIEVVAVGEAGDAGDDTLVYQGQPFAGPGAEHDLDLVGDGLAAGEAAELPPGALPTAVLVTAGVLDVVTAAGDPVATLAEGEALAVQDGLVLTAGSDGASFLAAVVGPAVPSLDAASTPVAGADPPPATASPTVAGTPAAAENAATEPPVAVETPPPPAVEPTPAADAAADTDGDGLTDADEAAINTDLTLPDTDGDGLTDGEEQTSLGTAPLAPDTDGDGSLDGDEVAAGTDPNDVASVAGAAVPAVDAAPAPGTGVADSDGDGYDDQSELALGTDPNDPDTDDDDLTDGDELFIFATGPLNPDTDGDGVLDGFEIANGTDPNDPTSF